MTNYCKHWNASFTYSLIHSRHWWQQTDWKCCSPCHKSSVQKNLILSTKIICFRYKKVRVNNFGNCKAILSQIENQPKHCWVFFPSCLAPPQITLETVISTDFGRSLNDTDIPVLWYPWIFLPVRWYEFTIPKVGIGHRF